MASIRRIPRLIVFDCDHTLWPFGIDEFYFKPPYHKKDRKIFDSQNKPMNCFPEVPQVLKCLHSDDIEMGVASRTTYPLGAHSLIDLFDWNQYFKYKEIFAGSKRKHFNHLKTNSGFSYKQMMFFDDELRNIDDIQPLGVFTVLTDKHIGITVDLVNEAIKKFANSNQM